MNEFNPELFVTQEFGFDETSMILLDEMSQAKITEENLRRCFSLRVASRILMLIYRTGIVDEKNNFLTSMDSLTRRITDVFSVFYEFLKPNASQPGFNHIIAMMNDSIIEFITHEYFCVAKGGTDFQQLTGGQISDLLNNIHITQQYTFESDNELNLVSLSTEQQYSNAQIRKIALANSWIKLYCVCQKLFANSEERDKAISELIKVLVEQVDAILIDMDSTNEPVVLNGTIIQTYYSTCIGLLCEIINHQSIFNNQASLGSRIDIVNLASEEFVSAIHKMSEHVRFLTKVHYEGSENE
ncbi:hypothetical protein [Citrobacter freundii]|uniref:hypothetical protein n=1 Tax=Citrobacter freundii TaxID=546 RepID=UPI001904BCE3|nr:hypothetical protein [Citrobacter freundii]MBJ8931635.1 hypothetical protein [Citrobacter freundii]